MRIIDADTVVTVQVFDEMYEEYNLKTMTIAEALDLWTEEGCPSSADAVSRKAKCCPITETCMSIDCPVSSEYIGRQSADAVPQLRQTDTLIIADALRYLAKDTERHLVDRTRADALRQQFLKYGASMCKGGDEE